MILLLTISWLNAFSRPQSNNSSIVDLNPPVVSFQAVSSLVAMLVINERFDTTGCYLLHHYHLSSQSDPQYQAPRTPVKVGRHTYVTGLSPGSGDPIICFELFLVFDKPLQNGVSYTLTAGPVRDLSGNAAQLDTTFIFSDEAIYGNVKVNQVGYLPKSPKLGKLGNFLGDAWMMQIDTINPPHFNVIDDSGQTVFTAQSKYLKNDSTFSGELVFDLDFSDFSSPGQYYLFVPGYGRSESFSIAEDVYNEAYYHSARALFYQRNGKLAASHAGAWAREGLPTSNALIHTSHTLSPLYSATDFPTGTPIPMQGGWLDAGDYGRYVPTAASALFILFTAFELYPQKFPDNHLNIPESGNQIPDLLDELKYETSWLKQMQAPDGGVYFRVTPATWSQGLPGEENNALYVSEKTTHATALFAAAMAMAARNLKKYFPAHADSCLNLAKKAWAFLEVHPAPSAPVIVPGIAAGPYPDPIDTDNRAWAAAELYKTTGDQAYNAAFQALYGQIPHHFHATMSWQQHTFKAAWAYATTTFSIDPIIVNEFFNKLNTEILVNYFNRTLNTHPYHGAYHHFKEYVGYGSFGMAQSYAFDYIMFSYLLNKPELLDYAKMQLDIPLGNNPLSKSFITGLGKKPPLLPLHWSTVPGKFPEPVPGIPVFGPAASLLMNRPSSIAIQDAANRYPVGFKKGDPYPVLRRYTDAREAVEMSEFTVQEIAVTVAAFSFFSSIVNENLPVRFRSFTARPVRCQVNLSWATSEEVNADYFSVQRSTDAKTFKEIGRVPAAGTSSQLKEYSFEDKKPEIRNYYRLKEVDLDSKFQLTRIISVSCACAGIKFIVSQIRSDSFEISIRNESAQSQETFRAQLINHQGTVVRRLSLPTNHSTELDGSRLARGIYILHITNSAGYTIHTQKLVIH
jgi:hypothetical protein